jgi:hypothetical protein
MRTESCAHRRSYVQKVVRTEIPSSRAGRERAAAIRGIVDDKLLLPVLIRYLT